MCDAMRPLCGGCDLREEVTEMVRLLHLARITESWTMAQKVESKLSHLADDAAVDNEEA